MLEGRTADCLAIANTAILMRLVEELIASGVITRPVATTVLKDAGDSRITAISWMPWPSFARN
jgi:hypothetical protein